MSALAPVAPRERVVTLDVLRGFALCGVMIGNMVLYSGRWAERPASNPTTLDEIAHWFLEIFVASKAQTLLTLLFGFGFAVQLLRAEERGEPVMGLYVRRLAALFVLGALHVTVLWWGDVTWTYAVSGFGLLAFLRTSNRARIAWALGFTFVPFLVVMSIPEVFLGAVRVFLEPHEFRSHTAQMAAALHRPDHAGLAWEHVQYALVWSAHIYAWYFFWTLGRFLLGYVAGQLRWFDDDGAGHLPVFRRLAAWGGAIAAVSTALGVLEVLDVIPLADAGLWGRLVSRAIDQIGLLAMTVTYVGIVVLLMQRAAWRRALRVVAPVGRMPLTTYFSQSLICTFLFYGWGLGWAGSVGVAGCLGLALAIFSVQIAICHVWLRYFRFGPLEWVWRSAVYLKLQPMRAPGPAL
ncbi:MAG TPA: DUF418 domain-containing protein [Kofleriaceae bacterium]|nr:DUF418 domain-containing protein [Kofleriaceae bacterium]